MRTRLCVLLLCGLHMLCGSEGMRTGPAVGSRVPAFEAADQSGHLQSLDSVSGPKGSLLVFFRSADW